MVSSLLLRSAYKMGGLDGTGASPIAWRVGIEKE
jgi:hypothetical protein